MDKFVKQSIDARKNAMAASYNLDANAKKKVDTLFVDIEELGEKCKDAAEFEAEFQKSPLNQKYLDLFTEIATTSQPKAVASAADTKKVKSDLKKQVAGGMVAGAAESALNQAVHTVVPTRAAVHQKAYDEARDIPVVGEAIDVAQKASYLAHLGKVFGKKKKKEEE
ncbi:hypothetical protein IKE98_03245 [Candidatus Saccharibacteria bacterium]|nr:hypothetical protein [Candidatus Saccharibacteria bacterium]